MLLIPTLIKFFINNLVTKNVRTRRSNTFLDEASKSTTAPNTARWYGTKLNGWQSARRQLNGLCNGLTNGYDGPASTSASKKHFLTTVKILVCVQPAASSQYVRARGALFELPTNAADTWIFGGQAQKLTSELFHRYCP